MCVIANTHRPAERKGWARSEWQLVLPSSSLKEGELNNYTVYILKNIKTYKDISVRRVWADPKTNYIVRENKPSPKQKTNNPLRILFQEYPKSP